MRSGKQNFTSNFFVIEGLDGAGTTTQAKKLAAELPNSIFTWEPTDSEIGKLLRRALNRDLLMDKTTMAYLFAADRSSHLYSGNGILEQCQQHRIFCDRYILSSFAYQTLDISEELVIRLNQNFPIPQITFFIDTPVNLCMQRLEQRDKLEIYEQMELQQRIRETYLAGIDLFKEAGWNIHCIDGGKSVEEIFSEICIILGHLPHLECMSQHFTS